ncbi:Protein PF14-0175 [Fukomys damarensis]|uniref:Protein PF14-0175 n=1 Tax=Fukomys damarensis TaxID=885580 RepID=A0A091D3K0_FUKDA|nr:Protein PF14-0175 [Fukomys damarensis]
MGFHPILRSGLVILLVVFKKYSTEVDSTLRKWIAYIMAASPTDEMEYDEDLGPISEECITAINHVIPYQMFISDVYLTMMPFLDKWENDEQALNSALKAEIGLTKLLEDLQTAASQAVDTHLLKFVEGYLIKQERNTTYLEREITYQKQLQELKEQELREQQMREQQMREQQMREQQMREQQMREQQEQEMKEKEQGQEMEMETKETKETKEQGPEQGLEQEPEQEQDMKKKEQGPDQEPERKEMKEMKETKEQGLNE